MLAEIVAVIHSMGLTVMRLLPVLLVLGAVFAVLSYFWACNPGRPWWRKRGLVTDLAYWFVIPLFRAMCASACWCSAPRGCSASPRRKAWSSSTTTVMGRWRSCRCGCRAAIFLIASDFMMYWLHRWFHRPTMWRYHAVHHSSEDLDWISAARFHPINIFFGGVLTDVVLLLAGISPNVLVFLGPFTIAHSAFVHANLNWTLGPFKYVLAGPVFHRWHHTAAARGGEKNFASTFPVLDMMFGSFYMPKDKLPDAYGVSDPMPPSFMGQMIYPFRPDSEVAPVRPSEAHTSAG